MPGIPEGGKTHFSCCCGLGINLEERKACEFTRHGVSGRRIVPHPVNPPRFFDSVIQEHSNLLVVLKPDEDLVHHFRIGCDLADIIQIVLGQVHENLVFSLREERHGIFFKNMSPSLQFPGQLW